MLFLGRNTIQWLALIALLLQAVGQFYPNINPAIQSFLNFATGVDAILIAWITQTSTTPTSDPRLVAGTSVTVTDAKGNKITDHTLP